MISREHAMHMATKSLCTTILRSLCGDIAMPSHDVIGAAMRRIEGGAEGERGKNERMKQIGGWTEEAGPNRMESTSYDTSMSSDEHHL
jgi:hypothetical protein